MINVSKNQIDIKFSHNLFHLNIMGIGFSLSERELQFLQDLIQIMLRDFGKDDK